MIQFVTLNTITNDLLNIIRGAQITQSEPISKRQIEAWIHQYRALLIKQDMDKGKRPNPDYIQTIQALELEEVSEAEGTTLNINEDEGGLRTFRTMITLPKTIDLNFKPGFTYIGTIAGQEIQFVAEGQAIWRQYMKYTSRDRIAFLRDGYLYVINDKEIRYITVRGIFEIPTEVSHLSNANEVITDATEDTEYPIPINMVPVLKEMILKQELGIEAQSYSDVENDSASVLSSPISGDTIKTTRRTR